MTVSKKNLSIQLEGQHPAQAGTLPESAQKPLNPLEGKALLTSPTGCPSQALNAVSMDVRLFADLESD
jgi:hypothetical protein